MKKVLLMGPSKSGKTSMRSMIFANFTPRDTSRLALTVELEHHSARILGNLVLSLWDCGGQFDLITMYKTSQRANFFSNVAILIYIFDSSKLKTPGENPETTVIEEREDALRYFQSCVEAVMQYSSEAKIYCLMHKMDLINENVRDDVFEAQCADVRLHTCGEKIEFFRTTIWDWTLYTSWNAIVGSQIPGIEALKRNVEQMARACELCVAAVYDKSTMLCICEFNFMKMPRDQIVRTCISVKAFKIAASKMRYLFSSFELDGNGFVAVIQEFTPNTLFLAVCFNSEVTVELLKRNVKAATKEFLNYLDTPAMADTKKMLC